MGGVVGCVKTRISTSNKIRGTPIGTGTVKTGTFTLFAHGRHR